MVGGSRGGQGGLASWIRDIFAASSARIDYDGNISETMSLNNQNRRGSSSPPSSSSSSSSSSSETLSDVSLGLAERAFSAAGAAILSAVLVNPLDVAKSRLQAQAAGVPYNSQCLACFENMVCMLPDIRCSQSRACTVVNSESACHPDSIRYKGTIDVFYKVIRQEGFMRLWRGTNASLALAVPTVGIYLPCYDILRNRWEEFTARNAPSLTPYVPLVAGSVARSLACITCYPVELARTRMQVFKEIHSGTKPPGVWRTLLEVISPANSSNNLRNLQSYRILWTGLGTQLARDVPFSAICWSILEPIRRNILGLVGEEASATSIGAASFSAGFSAGILAAAATCPLDVARTRLQIEKDPARALKMTTRGTLVEIWRDGGLKGLFAGFGPRVARAGPSVGIVVSFYEVVKFALQDRRQAQ